MGHSGRSLNARTLLTAASVAVFLISLLIFFEWGVAAALVCAILGILLFLLGQTKPRRGRGRRRY